MKRKQIIIVTVQTGAQLAAPSAGEVAKVNGFHCWKCGYK
jgi:hypothetical protein